MEVPPEFAIGPITISLTGHNRAQGHTSDVRSAFYLSLVRRTTTNVVRWTLSTL